MRISDWSSDVCSSDLEGIGEATRAAQIFKFFAGEALRIQGEKLQSVRPGVDVEITREPVGIVGIITPWNFPIAIPAWRSEARRVGKGWVRTGRSRWVPDH